jgi:hypothetical protein
MARSAAPEIQLSLSAPVTSGDAARCFQIRRNASMRG